jgi:hypothetical protein
MIFLTIASTYVGLFLGLFLGRISSEELGPGKFFIKVLRKSVLLVGVTVFSYIFLYPLFGTIGIVLSALIGILFWKVRFAKQLVVFFWPLALVAINESSLFIFVSGLFFLYLLIIGTEIVSAYVSKKDAYNITISKVELIKKGIKETRFQAPIVGAQQKRTGKTETCHVVENRLCSKGVFVSEQKGSDWKINRQCR